MNSGVYQLRHSVTGDIYVGSSENLKGRKAQHFSCLRHNRHQSRRVSECAAAHGAAGFVFEVLEPCEPELLTDRERHWVEKLNPSLNVELGDNVVNPGKKPPRTFFGTAVSADSMDDLVGVYSAGDYLGIKPRQVRNLITGGILPAQLVGRGYVIARADLAKVPAVRKPGPKPKDKPSKRKRGTK